MKLTKIFSSCLLVLAVTITLHSCSSDDNSELNPQNPEQTIQNPEQPVEEAISQICLDWNSTAAQVDATMNGYAKIAGDDNFACYRTNNGAYKVSYDFVNNALRSAAVIVASSAHGNNSQVYSLNGYTYIGNVDGAAIHTNNSAGNMAMVMNREIDGVGYITVGFAPIESSLFEKVEPISVEMLSSTDVTTSSFTARWKVSGDGSSNYDNSKLMLSTSPDMTSPKTFSGSGTGSGEFEAAISGLKVNTVYYLQAYVTIDGVRYDSEVISQELEHIETFSVGDFYPNATSPEGVVCRITGSGEHGTILSLDQDKLTWDVRGIFCTDYSSYNKNDGSQNDMGNSLPFAKWVYQHGTGWYGPAMNELCFNTSDLQAINAALSSKGYKELNGFYWSSTQKSADQSYVVTVAVSGYMGYGNTDSFEQQKDNSNYVRAMKKY